MMYQVMDLYLYLYYLNVTAMQPEPAVRSVTWVAKARPLSSQSSNAGDTWSDIGVESRLRKSTSKIGTDF